MFTHIVMFKLKDAGKDGDKTVEVLRNMEGKIPQLLSIEVGRDVLHSERSFDIALTTRFETLKDMELYQVHPVHQEVIRHMKGVAERSVSADYES